MGGGGKNAAKRQAEEARRAEEERQARIREGTAAINRTFDGGYRGVGAVDAGATYDPNQTYYTASGEVWTPTRKIRTGGTSGTSTSLSAPTLFGGQGSGGNKPKVSELFNGSGSREWEKALESGLYTGRESTKGFDDEFFDGIRQGYIDFAMPDFEKQFTDAREQATYNLARAGTLDSSIRTEAFSDLNEKRQSELQNLYDQANAYETESRSAVENARSDLISQLQVTGDATGAANAALSQAKILGTPPAYSPIQQLFQDAASTLATQAALERAEAYGSSVRPRFNTGLFGASPGAVKVT